MCENNPEFSRMCVNVTCGVCGVGTSQGQGGSRALLMRPAAEETVLVAWGF